MASDEGGNWGSWVRFLLLKLCLVTLAQQDKGDRKLGESPTETVAANVVNGKPANTLDNPPTMVEIKRAIPKRCFERKVSTSMYYVGLDVLAILALHLGYSWFQSLGAHWYIVAAVTPVFWLLQGTFFTAIFVLGHDCGHGSFSKHEFLNDVMGNICHSFLMIPYYCWKITHRNHHKNTANIDKDEVFYPIRKKDHRAGGFMLPGFGLGLGWYVYMVKGYEPRPVPHYNFLHHVFRSNFVACAISVAGIAMWGSVLFQYVLHAGLWALFDHYLIPLFVFGSWGLIFTFLHHCEEDVPWFGDGKWEFVRGQLSSIDRDYGWAHELTHTIGTHQIHHLFTKVPHYHLAEATDSFRKAFPGLVRYNTDRIIPTFVRMFKKYVKQHVIADDATEFIYK